MSFVGWRKNTYRLKSLSIFLCCFFWSIAQSNAIAFPQQEKDGDYICGGKLESDVWRLWDDSAKEYVRTQQFSKRLKEQGDTYALYDIQTFTHNLVAMAQRCQRFSRLKEIADIFGESYAALESVQDGSDGVAWICKGGAICNEKNKLLNREVELVSIQFLALTSSLANSLARRGLKREGGQFARKTTLVSLLHLLRWADAKEMQMLDKKLSVQSDQMPKGSTSLIFTDRSLWMIAIYAELSGILQRNPSLLADAKLTELQWFTLRTHLSKLLELFAARITLIDGLGRNGQETMLAEVDRGFWRFFPDNRYAGYSGNEKPVVCTRQPDGSFQKKTLIDTATLNYVDSIGWDISHARRLVHAFDAMERNRQAMQRVFGVKAMDVPSIKTIRAFAQQLLVKVWNGDVEYPLFSNYWSGTNGWYRVSYDNGTARCMEGYAPFGLSDSFTTGGYASWARYLPEIRPLGRQLYRLSVSDNAKDHFFVNKYYSGMGTWEKGANNMLKSLMFWPSLVESGN